MSTDVSTVSSAGTATTAATAATVTKASTDVTTWPEISEMKESSKCELVISGAEFAERIHRSGLDMRLFSLKAVNFLELSKLELSVLPKEIGLLVNLLHFNLQHNRLQTIPEEIGRLKKLRMLDMSRNELTTLPASMVKLTQLDLLNLSFNQMESVVALASFEHLTHLDMSFNRLKALPEEALNLASLSRLSVLLVQSNQLETLPEKWDHLASLKTLNVSQNQLKVIPCGLADCTKLKELDFNHNPIEDNRLYKLMQQNKQKAMYDYLEKQLKLSNESKKGGAGGDKKKKNKKKQRNTASESEEPVLIDVIRIQKSFGEQQQQPRKVIIDESTRNVRPYILCCIARNLDLTQEGKLKKFLSAQTRLHEDICQRRQAATMATHDLRHVPGDVQYLADEPERIELTPLGRKKAVTAKVFYEELVAEAESQRKEKKRNQLTGIHKYLELLQGKDKFPALIDSEKNVISFPPISNSDRTKMSADTTDILIEVTSSLNLAQCQRTMDALVVAMLQLDLGKTLTDSTIELDEGEQVRSVLDLEPVRCEDVQGNLRGVYPSRVDLQELAGNIRVVRQDE